MAQKTIHLETDYLIIGGGAMCMAFVDEMLIGSRNFGNLNYFRPTKGFLTPYSFHSTSLATWVSSLGPKEAKFI